MDHYEGEKVDPPVQIPWYPDGLAWSMTTPKNIVRRHPPFASFQKFLVSETSVGNISRQEAVSMIPPLLMDVRPDMAVLDMCAAPGSKAAQLIEMIHAGEETRVRKCLERIGQPKPEAATDSAATEPEPDQANSSSELCSEDDGRSTGLLIANDADYKRSHLLIHQMKRLNSPNLIVMNYDATMFPSIQLPTAPTPANKPSQTRYLKFDRILADVPCSGDGTARKNPNVWKDWTPGNALGLHQTQVRILVRAMQLLKVRGRVVYSTCSMNPIENEAVVATVIDRCGGPAMVNIVDCNNELPLLKRRPGLCDWSVMDKTGRTWTSWDSVREQKGNTRGDALGRISESMFPPRTASEAEGVCADRIPLERCIRVYAHLQDTGAFFITVLEKLVDFKVRPETQPKAKEPKPPAASVTSDNVPISLGESKSSDGPAETDTPGLVEPDLKPQSDAAEAAPNVKSPEAEETSTENQAAEDIGNILAGDQPNKRLKLNEGLNGGDGNIQTKEPPFAAEPSLKSEKIPDVAVGQPKAAPPAKKPGQPYEEPFKYLPADHADLAVIADFYQLSPRFPRDRFMVRNALGEPSKAIYYTTRLVKDILTENEGRGIKVVHSGVKMFMKQDVQQPGTCKWRIQMEGLPILEPWLGDTRTVNLSKRETLRKLLIEMFPKVSHGGWEALQEIGERVRDISQGCCVLRVEHSVAEDGFT